MPFNRKEYKRKYYQKNRDKYLQRYKDNRERLKAYQKGRYVKKPSRRLRALSVSEEAHKVHRHRRRVAVRDGDLTREQWLEILKQHDYKCVTCGAPYEHMDHIVPISKGGRHTADNVQPLCARCNMTKGSRKVFLP